MANRLPTKRTGGLSYLKMATPSAASLSAATTVTGGAARFAARLPMLVKADAGNSLPLNNVPDFKVPFVDALAGSLALHENATLVTADYDFKSVPSGVIKVQVLPAR